MTLMARFERPAPLNTQPRFAHASEAELARILDYYKVEWLYEPHVFPIRWNTDGVVAESFTPDFYLPELELYVELTTLKQSLVRKKNRKLRHLRELYPMVRIKLFYARDFRALLLKYGRLDAAASLIGVDGQAHRRDGLRRTRTWPLSRRCLPVGHRRPRRDHGPSPERPRGEAGGGPGDARLRSLEKDVAEVLIDEATLQRQGGRARGAHHGGLPRTAR